MARRTFNANEDEAAKPAAPPRPTNACIAHGCPMPGAIMVGRGGVCAWHHGHDAHDWPRITRAINDWAVIQNEINTFRRLAQAGTGAVTMAGEFHNAVQRVSDAYGGTLAAADFLPKPGNDNHTGYSKWVYDLSQQLRHGIRRSLGEVV